MPWHGISSHCTARSYKKKLMLVRRKDHTNNKIPPTSTKTISKKREGNGQGINDPATSTIMLLLVVVGLENCRKKRLSVSFIHKNYMIHFQNEA